MIKFSETNYDLDFKVPIVLNALDPMDDKRIYDNVIVSDIVDDNPDNNISATDHNGVEVFVSNTYIDDGWDSIGLNNTHPFTGDETIGVVFSIGDDIDDILLNITRLQLSVNFVNRLNYNKIFIILSKSDANNINNTLLKHKVVLYTDKEILPNETSTLDVGDLKALLSFSRESDIVLDSLNIEGGISKISFSYDYDPMHTTIQHAINVSDFYIDNFQPELRELDIVRLGLYDINKAVINTNNIAIITNDLIELQHMMNCVSPLGYPLDIITSIDTETVKEYSDNSMLLKYNYYKPSDILDLMIDRYAIILKNDEININCNDGVIVDSDFSDVLTSLGVIIQMIDLSRVGGDDPIDNILYSEWERYT